MPVCRRGPFLKKRRPKTHHGPSQVCTDEHPVCPPAPPGYHVDTTHVHLHRPAPQNGVRHPVPREATQVRALTIRHERQHQTTPQTNVRRTTYRQRRGRTRRGTKGTQEEGEQGLRHNDVLRRDGCATCVLGFVSPNASSFRARASATPE